MQIRCPLKKNARNKIKWLLANLFPLSNHPWGHAHPFYISQPTPYSLSKNRQRDELVAIGHWVDIRDQTRSGN